MNQHDFCRTLCTKTASDLNLDSSLFTVLKSSLPQHYTVEGPNRFHFETKTCCKWAAKAEAMDAYYSSVSRF